MLAIHRSTAIGLLGTGACLPRIVVANSEVGEPAGVDHEWIAAKTGICERRRAERHEATSDLALVAARAALEDAGLGPTDIDLIVVATSTPDQPQPPTAAIVADLIAAPSSVAAFDVNAVCSGFVFALSAARDMVAPSGGAALVVGADVYSRILDPRDRRTAVLFGDGAGAAVIGPVRTPGGILATRLLTFSGQRHLIEVAAGGSRLPASADTVAAGDHYFRMKGREVAGFVQEKLPTAIANFLHDKEVERSEIKHFVPHQANGHLIADLAHNAGLVHAVTHTTVADYGNTGAASVPITLDHVAHQGLIRRDELVLLAGFGGGMSIGMALVRW